LEGVAEREQGQSGGVATSSRGASLAYHKETLARIGGVLLIVFGLYTMGFLRMGTLDRERRLHLERKPMGFLGDAHAASNPGNPAPGWWE
ncbi:MAG TPA: hypothetical protein PLL69_12170, partial [Gemmatimonadales bacterium]|nr:hypothetical protein [Gemmatimonadales bacterium]